MVGFEFTVAYKERGASQCRYTKELTVSRNRSCNTTIDIMATAVDKLRVCSQVT